MRVVVADNAPLVRAGLVALLEHHGCDVVRETWNGPDTVVAAQECAPDVVLMDVRMPDGDEGIVAASAIRTLLPATAVLLLSQEVVRSGLDELFARGAVGYLLKETVAGPRSLVDALEHVAAGGVVVDPVVVSELAQEPIRGGLSGREEQVLALMATGASNRLIADRLGLSERTVEAHVRMIFLRLGLEPEQSVNRRVAAVLSYLGRAGTAR